MGKSDIEDAFSEVYHVWKAGAIVDVIECDTIINRVYEYKGKTPEFISGRGGTAILPSIEYMQKNSKLYTALVILTDGYHEFQGSTNRNVPILNKPVLHILTTNGCDESQFKDFYKTIKMKNL